MSVDILRLFGGGKTYWTKCRYRSLYSNKDSSASEEGIPGVVLLVKAKIKVEGGDKKEGFHAGMALPPNKLEGAAQISFKISKNLFVANIGNINKRFF